MKKGRTLVILILVIIGTIFLVAGSYAIWTYTNVGGVNNITGVGLELKYLESTEEVINITNAIPIPDSEGVTQDETFDFMVKTTAAKNTVISYDLVVQKQTVDTGYTALADSAIKIYLEDYEGNQLLAPTLISSLTNYVFYTGSHTHTTSNAVVTEKFRLRVWIDESLTSAAQNWTTATHNQYKFKVGVQASGT